MLDGHENIMRCHQPAGSVCYFVWQILILLGGALEQEGSEGAAGGTLQYARAETIHP